MNKNAENRINGQIKETIGPRITRFVVLIFFLQRYITVCSVILYDFINILSHFLAIRNVGNKIIIKNNYKPKCRRRDLNPQHSDCRSAAQPITLRRLILHSPNNSIGTSVH